MKIAVWQLYRYDLPLKIPPFTRSGIILYLENDEGISTFSEVAPLPLWSKETIDDAYQQLIAIKPHILKTRWNAQSLEELGDLRLYPSVYFGLDSAIYSLINPSPPPPVKINAFLSGSFDEIITRIAEVKRDGYQSAKLKINHLSLKDAKALIYEIKKTMQLRVDVNRAWPLEKTKEFFSNFPLDTFEYIEEPTLDLASLHQFPHPFALDESLREIEAEKDGREMLNNLPNLKALIIKPTLTGGFSKCLKYNHLAHQLQIKLIITFSLETAIGLYHLMNYAKRLFIKDQFLGLDSLSLFPTELLKEPFLIKQGMLIAPSSIIPNLQLLKVIN